MKKQLTTTEMERLLENHPHMSVPTRRLILTGQASFVCDGIEYRAPLTAIDDGPTHRMNAAVDSIDGEENQWN